MTNTRQPGYYRVKYKGKWTIGRWIHEDGLYHWAISETEYHYYYYSDNELDEIDPTPINPEPQQDNKDARIVELEKALNSLRGIEAWIGDAKMKQFFQKTVNSVLADQEAGKV